MGSEDFAVYLEHVPGTMFRLGAAGDERHVDRAAHADVRRRRAVPGGGGEDLGAERWWSRLSRKHVA